MRWLRQEILSRSVVDYINVVYRCEACVVLSSCAYLVLRAAVSLVHRRAGFPRVPP